MDNNLRIMDIARREEVFVYEVLKEFLFKNKITYIGDDVPSGLPDIFTDDFLIGVEVVTCERLSVYKYAEKTKIPIKFSMKIKSNKIVTKKSPKYINLLKEEFYKNLTSSIQKKLHLLKNGNYSSTREIFLCICSIYEEKPYIDIEKIASIYKQCSLKINSNFDAVFVIINKELYMINKTYNFMKLENYKNSRITVGNIN